MATDTQTQINYKDTLNLPQTAFAMEAKLVQNEPARLKRWQDAKLYDQVLAARAGAQNGSCMMGRHSPMATFTSAMSSTRRSRM